jgi:hypothetical protein
MDRERNYEFVLIVVIAMLMGFFIFWHEYVLAQEPTDNQTAIAIPLSQIYQRLVPINCGPPPLLAEFLKSAGKVLIYSGVGLQDSDNVVISVYENPRHFFTIVLWGGREACVTVNGQLGQMRTRPDFWIKRDD